MSRTKLMKIGPKKPQFNCRGNGRKKRASVNVKSTNVPKRYVKVTTPEMLNPTPEKMIPITRDDIIGSRAFVKREIDYILNKYHEDIVHSGQEATIIQLSKKAVELQKNAGIVLNSYNTSAGWVFQFLLRCLKLRNAKLSGTSSKSKYQYAQKNHGSQHQTATATLGKQLNHCPVASTNTSTTNSTSNIDDEPTCNNTVPTLLDLFSSSVCPATTPDNTASAPCIPAESQSSNGLFNLFASPVYTRIPNIDTSESDSACVPAALPALNGLYNLFSSPVDPALTPESSTDDSRCITQSSPDEVPGALYNLFALPGDGVSSSSCAAVSFSKVTNGFHNLQSSSSLHNLFSNTEESSSTSTSLPFHTIKNSIALQTTATTCNVNGLHLNNIAVSGEVAKESRTRESGTDGSQCITQSSLVPDKPYNLFASPSNEVSSSSCAAVSFSQVSNGFHNLEDLQSSSSLHNLFSNTEESSSTSTSLPFHTIKNSIVLPTTATTCNANGLHLNNIAVKGKVAKTSRKRKRTQLPGYVKPPKLWTRRDLYYPEYSFPELLPKRKKISERNCDEQFVDFAEWNSHVESPSSEDLYSSLFRTFMTEE